VDVTRFLAVAHQTAEAREFVDAIRTAADRDTATEFVLLVPATPVRHLASWTQGESRAVAAERARTTRRRLEDLGVRVIDARVGDSDPYQAIMDALATDQFDQVIVSTFPPGISRWLGADLINRLQRSIGVPVTHVVAH
jgi:GABA permease